MKKLSKKETTEFGKVLRNFYKKHGREDLPWRKPLTPYRVVVSEIMLQQTQVSRVEAYFKAWIKKWPNFQALARAPLKDILVAWQGLGYNRRAKFLHDLAKVVTEEYAGKLPADEQVLKTLPGIGPYTAGAVMAFVHNQPTVILETNIRTVLVHHFFQGKKTKVSEKELLSVQRQIVEALPWAKKSPGEFYWAMMDYGVYLKKHVGNLNKQTRAYQKQSKFSGSHRESRARVLRAVLDGKASLSGITKKLGLEKQKVDQILKELVREKLIVKKSRHYEII